MARAIQTVADTNYYYYNNNNNLYKINKSTDSDLKIYNMIENYIYLYHVNKFIILPAYADQVSDTTSTHFATTTPIARSAPIYSFSNAGPRIVQCNFSLHREMMNQINHDNNSYVTDDYVDTLIKDLQASVLPAYSTAEKMVNPPMVALRMSNDIFIKGVITSSIGITYKLPLIKNLKDPVNGPVQYAIVDFSLQIEEVDPYDAEMVMKVGSNRVSSTTNLNMTLERGFY